MFFSVTALFLFRRAAFLFVDVIQGDTDQLAFGVEQLNLLGGAFAEYPSVDFAGGGRHHQCGVIGVDRCARLQNRTNQLIGRVLVTDDPQVGPGPSGQPSSPNSSSSK